MITNSTAKPPFETIDERLTGKLARPRPTTPAASRQVRCQPLAPVAILSQADFHTSFIINTKLRKPLVLELGLLMRAAEKSHQARNTGDRGRICQRCIGCSRVFPTSNIMASKLGLCGECSSRSPYGWRTVYDRERKIGRIPAYLASAR